VIHIRSSQKPLPVASKLIKRAVEAALLHQSAEGDLSVVLTDDAQLQAFNRDYLGIDAPTDVLSFPAAETDPESGGAYLGDILISVPRAAQQAEAAGHALSSEVQLLVVHGVLHLLGHDHAKADEKSRMWGAQSAILESIGLADIQIRES
jgi:probable rRNA maturation factor